MIQTLLSVFGKFVTIRGSFGIFYYFKNTHEILNRFFFGIDVAKKINITCRGASLEASNRLLILLKKRQILGEDKYALCICF